VYDQRLTTLARMQSGEGGVVVQLRGGRGMANRLSALGIMPGKRVTKVGSMFMHGPVTIVVDRVQVAIGFGMANKVIVNLD
jgi:ferrous iron transport protein A